MTDVGTLSGRLEIEAQSAIVKVLSQIQTLQKGIVSTLSGVGTKVDKSLTKPLKQSAIAGSKTYGWLKDIGRIVQGIFISQVLYRGILQPIQQAVKELWNFNIALERTELAFKFLLIDVNNLMQNTVKLAEELIKDLKIIAAQTPFTMKTVTDAATTLLSLGFEQIQLRPMLVLMADLSAATGGEADQMEKLAWALGRVQQQGRMTRRELRLFVSARVPIMKILEEQLGITKFPNAFSLPADVAIPAILKGVMKFKGAAAEMELTMGGLLSSIHDYFLFISRDIFSGFFDTIKQRLGNLRKMLAKMWDIFESRGLSGLISRLFPPDIALNVWQLLHLFMELGKVIGEAWRALEPLRKEFLTIGFILMNWVVKGFIIFSKILQAITGTAFKSSKMMRILAATLVGLFVAMQVATAIATLVKIMQKLILFSSKAAKVIGLLVGLLVTLALTIPRVQQWFSSLGNTILKLFGIDIPNSIAVARMSLSGMGSDLGNIDWQQLIDGFSDAGDEAEAAGKKVKDTFLASFDEVYNIPEKAKAAGLGSMLGEFGELGDFGMPDMDIGIPDLGGTIEEETKNILEKIWDLWKQYVVWWRNTFLDGWGVAIDIAKKSGKLLWETITGFFIAIYNTITKTIDLYYQVTYDLGIAIGKTIRIVLDTIGRLILLFTTALGDSIIKIIELLDIIGRIIVDFFAILGKSFATGIATIVGIIFGGLGLILGTFQSSLALIIDIVSSGVGVIGEIFVALITYIKKPTIEGFREMKTNITSIIGGWVNDTAGKITGWASDTGKSFSDFKTNSTGTIKNWKTETAGLWNTFSTDTNKKLEIWSGEFGEIWTSWKTESVDVVDEATIEITKVWDTFKEDTKENFEIWTKEVGQIWTDYFAEVNEGWLDFIADAEAQVLAYNITVLNGVESLLGNIAKTFTSNKEDLKNSVWTYWQGAIESQRKAFKALADMPRPSGASVPGFASGGVIGRLPHLATGGVVSRDQIIRVGEGNSPEMVQPLNKTSMKPFADMIGGLINNNNQGTADSDYVMVPINKRDLERELYTIRLAEARRSG